MPIYILCNSAMKSLFRKHQGHILLVLAKKYIPTKSLEIYEDYPKELSENCLRFSPMVDKTTDINSHYILMLQGYHSVVALDASDKNSTGGLKLCLCTDSLFRSSERPTETVRKCRTQFRNVSFLSKKRKQNRSHHTAFVSDTTVYMEVGIQCLGTWQCVGLSYIICLVKFAIHGQTFANILMVIPAAE